MGWSRWLGGPAAVLALLACDAREGARSVAAGVVHACDLSAGGVVRCWGNDAHGQLGRGGGADLGLPEALELPPMRSLGAGGNTTCVVDAEGGVRCFGQNHHGQVGDGGREDRDRPVPVEGLPPMEHISVGFAHACSLSARGAVWCWGWNGSGQSAPGGPPDIDEPSLVDGVSGAVEIEAGFASTCAIDADRRAHCWGEVTGGPVQILVDDARAMAIGADHVCVLRVDELRCFGAEPGGSRPALPDEGVGLPFDAGDEAAGGIDHLCVSDRAGHAHCLGKNEKGQLGDGTFQLATDPVAVRDLPSPVESLAVGDRHSCAVADGQTFCWGWNDMGQIGDDTGIHTLIPVPVE